MSASDKKRQRKAEQTEQMTQKQLREQKEAAVAKRKKTIYTAVGVICAVAAVALLMWNHKGALDHGAVAAIVGGEDYKVPDLQYYYTQARNQTFAMYEQYEQQLGMSIGGPDATISDGAQWFNESENMTYADYFRENALTRLQEVTALCNAAKAEGYTLSEDGEKTVKEQLEQIDLICLQYGLNRAGYFSQSYGNGVTEAVFTRNLRNDLLAEEYATNHQESISYDDAALKAYYDEHPDELDSYDFRSFFIDGTAPDPVDADGNPVTDADGHTVTATDAEKEAAMNEAKAKADAAVAEIEAGEDREKTFAEVAPNYVSENYKAAYAENENYTLTTGVVGSRLTQNNSVISGWLMDSERKAGDVAALESTGNGYYVVLYLDRYLVEDPTVNVRHILIRPEVADGAAQNSAGAGIPTDEAMAAAKAEAESLMEEWKAGEATAKSFGELAEEHSADGGSNTNGGLYKYVSKGDMVPNFDAWCFDPARQPGDVGLVENSGDDARYYGWHVIYFEKAEEPAWKGTAISAKQSSDQTEWRTGIVDAVEAVAADGMSKVGATNTATPTPTASPAESSAPTESPAA